MHLVKLLWNTLAASMATVAVLVVTGALLNNLFPLYVLVFYWWAIPLVWLPALAVIPHLSR